MSSTLFTDAMALTPAGDGVYDGVLNEHWTIGPKVHGGRRVSLIDVELTQAVRTGDVGAPPARRAGGRSREEQKVAVRAAVTLGEPEHDVAPLSPSQAGGTPSPSTRWCR